MQIILVHPVYIFNTRLLYLLRVSGHENVCFVPNSWPTRAMLTVASHTVGFWGQVMHAWGRAVNNTRACGGQRPGEPNSKFWGQASLTDAFCSFIDQNGLALNNMMSKMNHSVNTYSTSVWEKKLYIPILFSYFLRELCTVFESLVLYHKSWNYSKWRNS